MARMRSSALLLYPSKASRGRNCPWQFEILLVTIGTGSCRWAWFQFVWNPTRLGSHAFFFLSRCLIDVLPCRGTGEQLWNCYFSGDADRHGDHAGCHHHYLPCWGFSAPHLHPISTRCHGFSSFPYAQCFDLIPVTLASVPIGTVGYQSAMC